ncbi:Leucine-rich repeat [Phytophthora cinnamomi]|uniref:Leucine-rich repeat n=1 Tax=Phytophthora cinnamomi TaxID=4785 RepID=UPI003559F406|nr:Leucine-rich repeat [Phytophthora cinnamomi]
MSSLLEEPLDEVIDDDRQELVVAAKPDFSEEENQIAGEEGSGEGTKDAVVEGNNDVSGEERLEDAVREDDDVSPWGEDETNQEIEVIAENEEVDDDGGDAWEWQLRVVQRVSEGMLDLSLFKSGGFDFVVVLNVQQNALRDLEPIAARAAVASSLQAEEQELQRVAAAVKVREAEALERRRDAKSSWFVGNRQDKRDMEAVRHLRSAEADKAERSRLSNLQRRINEDSEIKKMLRLM